MFFSGFMTYNTPQVSDADFYTDIQNLLTANAIGFSALNSFGEVTIVLDDSSRICRVIELLKTNQDADMAMLVDICGADYLGRDKRFELNYHLLSLTKNKRLRIKIKLDLGEKADSIAHIHSTACWFEREAFDMLGIEFNNSPDHRRILTDYNFVGFPLRKDFPLSGFKEIKYSQKDGKIIETPVEMTQEYRDFDFETPWAGAVSQIKNS